MPDQAAHQLQKTVDEITGYSRRTRKLIWGLAVSLALDITLSVIIAILSVSALSASSAVHRSQLAACAIANQTRVQQIQLWQFVITLSQQQPDANKAELRTFEAYLHKTFGSVDCRKLYP